MKLNSNPHFNFRSLQSLKAGGSTFGSFEHSEFSSRLSLRIGRSYNPDFLIRIFSPSGSLTKMHTHKKKDRFHDSRTPRGASRPHYGCQVINGMFEAINLGSFFLWEENFQVMNKTWRVRFGVYTKVG